MRQIGTRRIAWRVGEIEAKGSIGHQPHGASGEAADAQLRSLQVGQHANRPGPLALHLANEFESLLVLSVRTVAEVQAKHVDTRIEQGADHIHARARRPQGRDDLGVAVTARAHHAFLLYKPRGAVTSLPTPTIA